jgi:hypothetical protein
MDKPWARAVAAMRLSLIGMAFPSERRRASSSAHLSPVFASHGRHWRTLAPVSNQRSRSARFLPRGRISIPNRSSPSITGSTAISRSCARSHATTRGSGVGFVDSLRTLASTRYFKAYPSIRSLWEQRNPYVDRQAASRPRPRSKGLFAGRGDTHPDLFAQHRTPVPARYDLTAETQPAKRSAPSKIRWSSYR